MKLLVAFVAPVLATAALNIVVNTWSGPFEAAALSGYEALLTSSDVVEAVVSGCSTCEDRQCDGSVGYGNHPDTAGHTSLDALVVNGRTMEAGSVGFVRKYRNAVRMAQHVMQFTQHTLLVGSGAEEFEDMLGILTPQAATTANSLEVYNNWTDNMCQPNFYRNLKGSTTSCGPYSPEMISQEPMTGKSSFQWSDKSNHDTIGMVALDAKGDMACATTTNGANHKVAGRVGDSPIIGAGCYVNQQVGGAAATGDGDVMLRFLPSFAAVLHMQSGLSPSEACKKALEPIVQFFPSFSGGVVCLSNSGEHGAASYNMTFSYSYMSDETNGKVIAIDVP